MREKLEDVGNIKKNVRSKMPESRDLHSYQMIGGLGKLRALNPMEPRKKGYIYCRSMNLNIYNARIGGKI
jgi:hypothetical protein